MNTLTNETRKKLWEDWITLNNDLSKLKNVIQNKIEITNDIRNEYSQISMKFENNISSFLNNVDKELRKVIK